MNLKLERDEHHTLILPDIDLKWFPRCTYHTRYSAFFGKNKDTHFNTYHRSTAKKLADVQTKQFTFLGNQIHQMKAMNAKTGNYYNPFHFEVYKQAVELKSQDIPDVAPAFWYDKLLKLQKQNAKFVIKNAPKSPRMKINADHAYPCVLVSLTQPEPVEKNVSIWTNFISLFLIAIANRLAAQQGLNIELVRRSSFDAIRPSVAECGKSLRISLGMTPKAYHLMIVKALGYLDKLFENTEVFEVAVDPEGKVKKVLDKYNQKRASEVALGQYLWTSLWMNGDCSNRSFATQIFRREVVVETIIDKMVSKLHEATMETIFESKELKRACFATPFLDFFASLYCNESDALTTHLGEEPLKLFGWPLKRPFKDKGFWSLVQSFSLAIGASQTEVDDLCSKKNLGELYHYLELWLAKFTFTPQDYKDVVDGYGSDSDLDDDVKIKEDNKTIHSKKLITATGMRAIQLCYATAVRFLETNYDIDPSIIGFNAEKMYYETQEAIHSHPIELPPIGTKNKGPQKKIGFFDLNHCNTEHLEEKRNLVEVFKKDRICVLDATSATTLEIAKNLVRIWKKAPMLRVILVVSSGLKNEQAMSDYNPYGCIRIFSSSSKDCDAVYQQLLKLEQQASYLHPKESHLIRKHCKDHGFTPTNASIIGACKSL